MARPPGEIDVAEVERALLDVPGVISVHDMHIWAITSRLLSLSAHVLLDNSIDSDTTIETLCVRLEDRFHIVHSTIQIERRLRDEDVYHQPDHKNVSSATKSPPKDIV